VSWDGADEPAEGDVQDEVPLEWIRMLEREREEEEGAWRARHERMVNRASWMVPAGLVGAGVLAAIMIAVFSGTSSSPATPQAPAALPAAVQAFAKTLPASQSPNPAGLTLVDGTDAPSTWRVAWETEQSAFCFAFVHASEPSQTLCGAPGSVKTAQMRIGGELSDTALTQPELFVCGYTTGPAEYIAYVEINDGDVVGTAVDMGSGLSAYCLQLPEDMAAGASFTVSTYVATTPGAGDKGANSTGVSATYP
jgi:hypothetical protein